MGARNERKISGAEDGKNEKEEGRGRDNMKTRRKEAQ